MGDRFRPLVDKIEIGAFRIEGDTILKDNHLGRIIWTKGVGFYSYESIDVGQGEYKTYRKEPTKDAIRRFRTQLRGEARRNQEVRHFIMRNPEVMHGFDPRADQEL